MPPLPPETPLDAKVKEEERGERRKKKREEDERAPLVLGWLCHCVYMRGMNKHLELRTIIQLDG